jgi:hypothetical protein
MVATVEGSKLPRKKVLQHWPIVANLNTTVIYCSILTLERIGTVIIYYGIFIRLVKGVNVIAQYRSTLPW